MTQAQRHHAVLARGTATAEQLAEQFGVSVRTIYRDIAAALLAELHRRTLAGLHPAVPAFITAHGESQAA